MAKFVVHKTRRIFSSIPIDQAHEQNNALIKGSCWSHGSALQWWMVAGPEVSRVVEDVLSLISVIEHLGNPFEEESTDLLVLDSKEIADHAAVETVKNARRLGQEQFHAFC